jgi:hypothetical protein
MLEHKKKIGPRRKEKEKALNKRLFFFFILLVFNSSLTVRKYLK